MDSGDDQAIPMLKRSNSGLLPDGEIDRGDPDKYWSIGFVGILTLGYSIFEIYLAILQGSLALLSDGFHNLSDVLALIIAFYAMWKSSESKTQKMTFGWKRAEVLGAVMNGCFLLALCLYIILEAIPKFITPEKIDANWWYIGVAGAGLVINFLATIIFAATGTHGHSHAGGGDHGHSHGGGGHGGHGEKKDKHKHGHGHGKDKHDDEEDHGHGHGKDKHNHAHKEKKDKHNHAHKEKKDKHNHAHKEKKDKHNHGHAINSVEDDHDHNHGKKESPKMDMNMQAVFIHYLGDAVSSLFVLAAGLIIHFVGNDHVWVHYVDPASSLLIVALVCGSVLPLLKNCSKILLQQAPPEVDCTSLNEDLLKVKGIRGIHDLHVWQLVDNVTIASAHVSIWECDVDAFKQVVARCKKVFHKYDIHSSTLQPEFVIRSPANRVEVCKENCITDCPEDWCCKNEYIDTAVVDYDTYQPSDGHTSAEDLDFLAD